MEKIRWKVNGDGDGEKRNEKDALPVFHVGISIKRLTGLVFKIWFENGL